MEKELKEKDVVEEENKLIERAKNGDEKAKNEFLNNYKQLVSYVTRHYFLIGGDKDDLIQEGMIGLFDALTTYDETKNVSFSAYAKTLIERNVINAIKKDAALKNYMLNNSMSLNNQGFVILGEGDNDEVTFAIQSEDLSPETQVISSEDKKELILKIKTLLSNFEFKVLKLYLKGYNYCDIAQELQTNPKRIDNALNRIKTKLKRKLKVLNKEQ